MTESQGGARCIRGDRAMYAQQLSPTQPVEGLAAGRPVLSGGGQAVGERFPVVGHGVGDMERGFPQ